MVEILKTEGKKVATGAVSGSVSAAIIFALIELLGNQGSANCDKENARQDSEIKSLVDNQQKILDRVTKNGENISRVLGFLEKH